jgi:hypothetical protein
MVTLSHQLHNSFIQSHKLARRNGRLHWQALAGSEGAAETLSATTPAQAAPPAAAATGVTEGEAGEGDGQIARRSSNLLGSRFLVSLHWLSRPTMVDLQRLLLVH